MPFTPKGIFYFLCDVFYGLLSFILFVIGAKASVAQPKSQEGIKGIALRAPLASGAACSLFLKAKNALSLETALFLKFLRYCPGLASGTCPELTSGGM